MLDLDDISHNCIIASTQDLSPRSRIQLTLSKNLNLGNNFSCVTLMGMILHTIVVHDPGVVLKGSICPY